jgi:hypothetical protein
VVVDDVSPPAGVVVVVSPVAGVVVSVDVDTGVFDCPASIAATCASISFCGPALIDVSLYVPIDVGADAASEVFKSATFVF